MKKLKLRVVKLSIPKRKFKKLLLFLQNLNTKIVVELKNNVVYRLFWGRGNLYKKVLHSTLIILTIAVISTGLSTRISSDTALASFRAEDTIIVGESDLLEQGGTVESVLALNSVTRFKINIHKVKEGESIESVAKIYAVTKETVRDSNNDKIDYYDPKLTPGDDLYIPEISGVLYKSKKGDSIAWIMTQVDGGDLEETMELNGYRDKEQILENEERILIPGATRKAPPRPTVAYVPVNTAISGSVGSGSFSGINFVDPLSHPACSGYGWSRGFTGPFPYGHDGVDLTKRGGCPIRAAATGTVIFSGTESYGGALAITIDHGNGIHTIYYHMSANYVRAGQHVNAGDEIGYMGCTGWCSGTHLHLSLRVNYTFIDPSPYVPYRRPY